MFEINEKKDCTGCYACSTICPQDCISMESDNEGFWYPAVDYDKCTKCGLCEKVCPIIHSTGVINTPVAYAAYNKDEKIRLDSSSGGVFTLLAEHVIYNGGVVFGVRFDDNFNVLHDYTETRDGLVQFRGSKYVQSKIGDSYKQIKEFLDKNRQVLFTGTPCQVGGLKSYLEQAYDNLFCIDNICHGVASPRVWLKYLSYQENRAGAPARKIAFRQKNEGWKRYSVSFLFDNDTEYCQTFDEDFYMRAFLRNICLRPSCYFCNFKTLHRQSDITLADFWGIGNVFPEMDDDKGTSLVFVNSNSGKKMLEEIKKRLEYKVVDINKAVSHNSSAIRSVAQNSKREFFFHELDQLRFDRLVNKYCSDGIYIKCKKQILKLLPVIK